jgi:hypothetical protein
MKEIITNFVLGTAGTFGATLGTGVVDTEQIGSIEDIIRYIISVLGGILAAIIIRILKNKFPELFEKKKKN